MAIRFSPLAVTGFPRERSWFLPASGHGISPRAVMRVPYDWLVAEWLDPLSSGGVGESDRVAVGDHDVGVMQQSIDQR